MNSKCDPHKTGAVAQWFLLFFSLKSISPESLLFPPYLPTLLSVSLSETEPHSLSTAGLELTMEIRVASKSDTHPPVLLLP